MSDGIWNIKGQRGTDLRRSWHTYSHLHISEKLISPYKINFPKVWNLISYVYQEDEPIAPDPAHIFCLIYVTPFLQTFIIKSTALSIAKKSHGQTVSIGPFLVSSHGHVGPLCWLRFVWFSSSLLQFINCKVLHILYRPFVLGVWILFIPNFWVNLINIDLDYVSINFGAFFPSLDFFPGLTVLFFILIIPCHLCR